MNAIFDSIFVATCTVHVVSQQIALDSLPLLNCNANLSFSLAGQIIYAMDKITVLVDSMYLCILCILTHFPSRFLSSL